MRQVLLKREVLFLDRSENKNETICVSIHCEK